MSNQPPIPSQQATTISEGKESTGAQKTELRSRLRGSMRISWRWLYKHHEVLTVIASWAGVIAAISLVVWQNKVARDTASQQNFMQFYQQWESDGMQERRARLAAALLANPVPKDLDDSPLVFLETLSKATSDESTDYDLVWTTFYYDLTNYWAAAKSYALETRKSEKCECIFEELEKMSKRFVEKPVSKHPKQQRSPEEEQESVKRFLNWEVNRRLTQSELNTRDSNKDVSSPAPSRVTPPITNK